MLQRRAPLIWSALAGVLSVALAVPAPAAAGQGAEPPPLPPVESTAGRHSSSLRETALMAPPVASAAYFTVDEQRRQVAPGLELTSLDRYDARGWIRVDALSAELSTPGLRLDYASPGKVSSRAPLSVALRRDDAVAGVNADFFDIADTGAPLGIGVDRQRGVIHGSSSGRNNTFTLDSGNVAAIARTYLRASIVRTGKPTIEVTNLNAPVVASNGIGMYTSAWGSTARSRVVTGSVKTREVVVAGGRVRATRKVLGSGAIPRDQVVLVGVGKGAARLSALQVGSPVAVQYGVDTAATRVAVGGSAVLLRAGSVVAPGDPAVHPRTAVGIDTDLNRVLLVTVDGRQAHSRGLTLRETAVLLRRMGAEDALNLDGGGSSTMLARESGEATSVVNEPSGGQLRRVPNGLGFAVAAGSGRLRGVRIEPVADADDSHRVLTGLSRVLVARGHDETLDPVSAKPTWRGSPTLSARQGRAQMTVVRGRRRGAGTVTAAAGRVGSTYRMSVLGRVHRLETSVPSIALSGKSVSQGFAVRGYDARGFGTWVEPRDVRLSYDRKTLRVRRTDRGFTVTSLVASAADVVRVRAGGRVTDVGVTVGLASRLVSRMNSLSGWEATSYPATTDASLAMTTDRRGRAGSAVAMRYSLPGAPRIRAAYLTASPTRTLARKARTIGMWVRGDGKGAWLRVTVQDASGARSTLSLSQRVNWRGWRFVSTALPAGLAQPLEFVRVYAVETKKPRRYSGTLAFDDLTVRSERTASVPATPPRRDPLVADLAPLGAGGLTVAVISDARILGVAPDSRAVARTRRIMREVVASRPNLVLINGDLVNRGGKADFALAKRLVHQELAGKVRWRYLPGDAEIRQSGDLANFRAEFGAPVRTLQRKGTRFVLLNSALGTFRLGGFAQLVRLRSVLKSVADEPSVRSVVVVAHHPTNDPNAGGTAELADPREGELVESLLADFRSDTGKPAAYVGSHARRFGVSRRDDVPVLVAGPVSDPVPAGAGSFIGWSRFRIEMTAAPWLRAEFRPLVDALRMNTPGTLGVGSVAQVSATVTQAGRRLPLSYPMGSAWLPSPTLHVGAPGGAPRGAVAAYNPATRKLTGIRAGEATLVVRVNGMTARRAVTVR